MSIELNYDDKVLYNELNQYFYNNIKFSLKIDDKVFILTKSDIFYEINIRNEKLSYFILNDDKQVIESMIVEKLSNKGVDNLIYGKDHCIARTNGNKLYFIGYNKLEVNEVLSDLNISDVKYGYSHTLLLTSSGEVYAWGSNYFGQICKDGKDWQNTPIKVNGFNDERIVMISCGDSHSMALTESGYVYSWGYNIDGQLGNGCGENQSTPIKVNGFNNERIIMISCGGWHSMALTESGRVYSWGYNSDGQLGIGNRDDSNTPKPIDLNAIIIQRLSCGEYHSLLLSNDGVIYAFGCNLLGQIGNGNKETQLRPVKLSHEIKFIDIAAHSSLNISVSLSVENICYVWGYCKKEYFSTPIKTNFKTFAEVFNNYTSIQYEISEKLIEFEDQLFRFGYFDKKFKELEEIGSGSYGNVYKVRNKSGLNECYAIKKTKPINDRQKEFVKEFDKYLDVRHFHNPYIVQHFDAWFENNINNERLVLYIQMELCDTTLNKIIEEIQNDINLKNKNDNTLTPIGYYIASQLFIEIVKGVQYLHQNNIIHRDLNPNNIMIKREKIKNSRKNRSFVKIGDFGLIAIHNFCQQLHTRDRGTLKYMAPEVDSGKYDTKADIFSIGIIFRELFNIDMNRYLFASTYYILYYTLFSFKKIYDY
jgi:serine/threonine protein kinase